MPLGSSGTRVQRAKTAKTSPLWPGGSHDPSVQFWQVFIWMLSFTPNERDIWRNWLEMPSGMSTNDYLNIAAEIMHIWPSSQCNYHICPKSPYEPCIKCILNAYSPHHKCYSTLPIQLWCSNTARDTTRVGNSHSTWWKCDVNDGIRPKSTWNDALSCIPAQ
jgi:hypothetical protein